jgi:SWI/SNF-related matrix-associated actin-dependent regulator of chromatin subfamily A-like protein 1
LPEVIRQKVFAFQADGIEFGLRKYGRCLIGDEMGVGKTLQALSIAWLYRFKDWPLLILAPSSLKLQWRDELLRWLPMRERDIFAFTSVREVDDFSLSLLRDGSIVIVSYDLATKLAENGQLARFKFGCVIADEAHYLKNYDAKRTRLLTPVL